MLCSVCPRHAFYQTLFLLCRGCRHCHQISPCIFFLLCAKINSFKVKNDESTIGIKVNNTQYLISNYADYPSLILDGSEKSLRATRKNMDDYYSIRLSGLKVNHEQTQIVWIGSNLKKNSEDKNYSERILNGQLNLNFWAYIMIKILIKF